MSKKMTRTEKLYSMKGSELIKYAAGIGVKLPTNKAGTALKIAKDEAITRIIDAENRAAGAPAPAEETERRIGLLDEVTITVTDNETGEQEVVAPAEEPDVKKERKGRKSTKKTFEELVADIPAPADVRFIRGSKGAVHVKMGTESRRLFGYSGPIIVVTDERLVDGLEYEEKSYGYRLAPTAENMKAIFTNYRR